MFALAWAGGARAADAALEEVRAKAQACADAMLKGDYEAFVGYTHPKVIELVGGREKMLETLRKGTAQMKAQGIAFVSFDVAAPANVIGAGKPRQLAVVPTKFEMTSGTTHIKQEGFLLAVSDDAGKSWTFIDGAGLTDKEQLKQFLGDVPAELKLPARKPPVVEQGKKQ
jgi:hypothetical protein